MRNRDKGKVVMITLLKGGTAVTATATIQTDILIEGEQIAAMGPNLTVAGATIVDARDHLILPGGIDPHTHLQLPFFSTVSADDFYTGHKAALFGGTTSHIDFATQRKGQTLHEALERWHKKAVGKAVMDYGVHMSITDLRPDVLAEIPTMPAAGVTSLKLFLSYVNVYMLPDDALFQIMQVAAEHNLLVLVHAENGHVVDALIRQNVAAGNLATEYHAHSHPAWSEAEATMRAIALAATAGASLYVVHMTCEEAVDMLRYGRSRQLPVMGETCPQYLFFTEEELRRPDGAKWVFSPPVRQAKDNEALWQALADGSLQVVGTDHCPFLFDGTTPLLYEGEPYQNPGKELGQGTFLKYPTARTALRTGCCCCGALAWARAVFRPTALWKSRPPIRPKSLGCTRAKGKSRSVQMPTWCCGTRRPAAPLAGAATTCESITTFTKGWNWLDCRKRFGCAASLWSMAKSGWGRRGTAVFSSGHFRLGVSFGLSYNKVLNISRANCLQE
jgi:dihydropyrimidinase